MDGQTDAEDRERALNNGVNENWTLGGRREDGRTEGKITILQTPHASRAAVAALPASPMGAVLHNSPEPEEDSARQADKVQC